MLLENIWRQSASFAARSVRLAQVLSLLTVSHAQTLRTASSQVKEFANSAQTSGQDFSLTLPPILAKKLVVMDLIIKPLSVMMETRSTEMAVLQTVNCRKIGHARTELRQALMSARETSGQAAR